MTSLSDNAQTVVAKENCSTDSASFDALVELALLMMLTIIIDLIADSFFALVFVGVVHIMYFKCAGDEKITKLSEWLLLFYIIAFLWAIFGLLSAIILCMIVYIIEFKSMLITLNPFDFSSLEELPYDFEVLIIRDKTIPEKYLNRTVRTVVVNSNFKNFAALSKIKCVKHLSYEVLSNGEIPYVMMLFMRGLHSLTIFCPKSIKYIFMHYDIANRMSQLYNVRISVSVYKAMITAFNNRNSLVDLLYKGYERELRYYYNDSSAFISQDVLDIICSFTRVNHEDFRDMKRKNSSLQVEDRFRAFINSKIEMMFAHEADKLENSALNVIKSGLK